MTSNDDDDDNDHQSNIKEKHLGWTKKQGWILSGGGQAETLFVPERGFTFQSEELPHTHLLAGNTHDVFQQWKASTDQKSKHNNAIVIGAWERPLFVGGYQHSSSHDEETYNLQSSNLFIDLRVPRTRSTVLRDAIETRRVSSLEELTAEDLRLYARQHVFGGYTRIEAEPRPNGGVRQSNSSDDNDVAIVAVNRPVATRHHAIDWNFVGTGRPRPNKWWINVDNSHNTSEKNPHLQAWEELAYATDDWSKPYYFERWERHDGGIPTPRLALRRVPSSKRKDMDGSATVVINGDDDGIIVIVGDHFNYLLPRRLTQQDETNRTQNYSQATSLVDLVDAAIEQNDLSTARAYLSIEAGHGRVSPSPTTKKTQWILDCTIPFWNEGKPLWDPKDIQVIPINETATDDGESNVGNSSGGGHQSDDVASTCRIMWKSELWDIYDCSFNTVEDLKKYFLA